MWWLQGLVAMAGSPDNDAVEAVLDRLHAAADSADLDGYFGLFTDDAVFVGTDDTEVWDLAAFRGFAAPHFEQAPAWSYTPLDRRVRFDRRGRTAWFHERLDHARYGRVRGSGVLERGPDGWRIAQYVLSFPIPNDAAAEVLQVVARHGTDEAEAWLPTPYTAAQIRSGCAPGTTIVTRRSAGDDTSVVRTRFVGDEGEVAVFVIEELDAQGAVRDPGEPQRAPWVALRDHARFPAGGTTWQDVTLDGPLGPLPVRRYVVTEGRTVRTFWFSPDHPGPPLKMTIEAPDAPPLELLVTEHQRSAP